MQWLMALLGFVVNPLGWLPAARRQRVIRWGVHILIVVAVVVGLGFLNHYGGLDRVLRTRFLGIYRVWLPVLFLLGYAFFWLVRWLYWLLGPDGVVGEFDDIEAAWKEARGQLEGAGVGLNEAPLFLVIGKPGTSLETFFAASRLPLQVRAAPSRADAPLHVYASREAIFVTCEGAALLPLQISRLLEAAASPVAAATSPLDALLPSSEPVVPLEGPTTGERLAEKPSAAAPVLLLGETPPAEGASPRVERESLLKDQARVELATRRLRHVCRVLFRDRQPYCPANGLLVLVPMVATETPEDASETAAVVRHDLEVAREALQLECPRFIILCDGETLPGFPEVVRHFPQTGTGPRWVLGQHYAFVPDITLAELPAMIETGLAWVSDTMLPVVVSQLLRREGEEGVTDRARAIEANVHLYEFLIACRQRIGRLGHLAARGTQVAGGPMLLGCYVAGTGPDGERDQGFLAGVMQRVIEKQNLVRWVDDAVADDNAYHRYTLLGYGLLVFFVLLVGVILYAWW